ncbi:TetR/AcrR family transcriptional regulator [Rhodococcus sp. 1168]|uniref:TetR/AcrR family transcriptional regulator n=1 Tax=Rhodococcus sp. 1168 TaxID=2018041 RepID=UPI000A0DECCF|nr:TetR/AcrR family transcriptional regulator [Rhodococcus sp. 1168]ORI13557.1 hypothetical protein BJI47_23340 [Rhodococcus sp. 1168]
MANLRNTAWFALAVQRRRIDLGLARTDVPTLGGPSAPTMAKIETGYGVLTSAALGRLELAMEWTPGSAARALSADIKSLQDVLDAVGYDDHRSPAPQHGWPHHARPASSDWSTDSDWDSSSGKRLQPRATRTRAALVAAAAREFTTHGYTAASLNIILDRADCSKGAMYFHFSCKAELADGVLTDAEQLYTAIAERWRTAESAHPLDAIACLVDAIADEHTAQPLVRAETYLALEPRLRTRRPSRVWESALRELAAKATDLGCIRPEFSADTMVRALTAAIVGHFHLYLTEGVPGGHESPTLKTRLSESVETVFAAMATPQYLAPATTARPA